jgi:hypothetical protein
MYNGSTIRTTICERYKSTQHFSNEDVAEMVKRKKFLVCVLGGIRNVKQKYQGLVISLFETSIRTFLSRTGRIQMLNKMSGMTKKYKKTLTHIRMLFAFLKVKDSFPIWSSLMIQDNRKHKSPEKFIDSITSIGTFNEMKNHIVNNQCYKVLNLTKHFHWFDDSEIPQCAIKLYVKYLSNDIFIDQSILSVDKQKFQAMRHTHGINKKFRNTCQSCIMGYLSPEISKSTYGQSLARIIQLLTVRYFEANSTLNILNFDLIKKASHTTTYILLLDYLTEN